MSSAYLAGGTALALQLGHRESYDFDFFTPEDFNEDIFLEKLTREFPSFTLEEKSEGTILGYLGETRFSLFYYMYHLLSETKDFMGIRIADIPDIVAMKIAALADRGTKRDFIDLYFICAKNKIMTLADALVLYDKKFKTLASNRIHILKSMVYFDDAENDELPRMIEPVSWKEVKSFFEKEQGAIARNELGEN